MTAGRISVNELQVPHRGTRPARRAAIGSIVVIVGLAVTLAMLAAVAYGGPRAATVPEADPAVALPAAPTVSAVPTAAPATVVPAPTLVLPSVFGPAGPGRAPSDRIPGRPWPGRSWGLHMD